MKNLSRIGLLVILVVTLVGQNGRHAAAAPEIHGNRPVIVPNSGGLILDWQVPQIEIKTNADGQVEVSLPGVEREEIPGQVQLPVASLLVALPPYGTPSLSLINTDLSTIKPGGSLAVAPNMKIVQRNDGSSYEVDATPEKPVKFELASLEEVGVMRGVRLGRLVIHPVLDEGGQLKAYSHIKVALQFNAPFSPSVIGDDAILKQVQGMVVNPSQLQSTLASAPTGDVLPQAAAATAPVMVMEINEAGLYQVTFDALQIAGFFSAGAVNPIKIHLNHNGQEVAYEWIGDGDTIFETGEALQFYAKPRTNRWSTFDTYFLTVMDTDGTRMQTRSAAPTTAPAGMAWAEKTFEQNLIYTPDSYFLPPIDPGRDGDVWMWEQLSTGTTRNYYFDLSAVDTTQQGNLTVFFNGYTALSDLNPDHKVNVFINDQLIGSALWDGKTAYSIQLTVPANKFKATGNKLTLTLPNTTVDGVWLDAFTVRYRLASLAGDAPFYGEQSATARAYTVNLNPPASALAYNTTIEHAPVRLTNLQVNETSVKFEDTYASSQPTYLVTTAPRPVSTSNGNLRQKAALLTAGTNKADYLIIAHPLFINRSEELAAHRRSKGLTVAKENVQAIYDAFGQGIPTPQAIQDYLKVVYQSWNPKPQYVVLVGDGTWDPKRYFSNSAITYIPPFVKQVDPFTNEEAADNRFVTMDGTLDVLADIMIGRLPVNNDQQLSAMITKIIQYENNTVTGDWQKTGTLVADHPLSGDYNFYNAADTLNLAMRPAPINRQKIYYQWNYPTGATTRTAILNGWNAGTSILAYFGHSSFHQWGGKYPNELFFHIDNVPSLVNGVKLPMVLEMTCFTSQFHVPGLDVLDEALVRSAAGGAIATFGSTGPGFTGSHLVMGKAFVAAMQSVPATAGQAMFAAKLALISDANVFDNYLADTFLILGDPATQFKMKVYPNSFYLPIIKK